MQDANSRQITVRKQATIDIPKSFASPSDVGALDVIFIDGIDCANPDYSSAVVVGSASRVSPALGIVACYNGSYRLIQADANDSAGWPLKQTITAVCGANSGNVAFATYDVTTQKPQVLVHSSPASVNSDWKLQTTITLDAANGTVQAMQCRDEIVYGFIKGDTPADNAFFYGDLKNAVSTTGAVFPSYSTCPAVQSFFPLPGDMRAGPPFRLYPLRRIAFCDNMLFALDEQPAAANAVSTVSCVVLDEFGMPIPPDTNNPSGNGNPNVVNTVPLAKHNSFGVVIHENLKKAYSFYIGGEGNVMPYTVEDVDDKGVLTPGKDSITAPMGACPTVDQNLGLIYLVGVSETVVSDVATDATVAIDKQGDTLGGQLGCYPSAWVDSANSIFYLSGEQVGPDATRIAVYHIVDSSR